MNKVIVKVTGEQTDAAGDVSRIEMTALGEHYFRNGKHYIIYEDTSLAEGVPASTMLKVASDSLTLTRRGAVEQEQHFSPQSESRSRYQTLRRSVLTSLTDLFRAALMSLTICISMASGSRQMNCTSRLRQIYRNGRS